MTKLYKYNVEPMNEDQKRAFVQKCEDEFEAQLERAADIIINDDSKIDEFIDKCYTLLIDI